MIFYSFYCPVMRLCHTFIIPPKYSSPKRNAFGYFFPFDSVKFFTRWAINGCKGVHNLYFFNKHNLLIKMDSPDLLIRNRAMFMIDGVHQCLHEIKDSARIIYATEELLPV